MRAALQFPALALLAGASVCVAQQADPADPQGPVPTLRVETRLVVLDVEVTDKHGNPVTDLTKADFNLYEDKTPKTIRTVDPPSAHALPPGLTVRSSADLRKIGAAPVDILVLDALNTQFEDNAYSRYSLQKYLKAQPAVMPPTTLLAANDKSFFVLVDYTQDRDALLAALKRDPVQYPWRLARNDNSGPDAVVRLGQTLATLNEIAQSSMGTPGRKNIIWVGRGFPSVDLTGLDDAASKPLTDAVRRTTDLLLRARATLTLIDPTPLSSATYDPDTPTDLATLEAETLTQPFSDAVRFSSLAPMTGGRTLSARNDIDREIATSVRNGDSYYTLSYSPGSDNETPGDYRHIRITLNRPGVIATTRDGYYVQPAAHEGTDADAASAKVAAKLATDTEVLDLAGAALSKLAYNGVALRAGAGAGNRFSLAVSDASLNWHSSDDGQSEASLSVVAVCFSPQGKVLSHVSLQKVLRSAKPNAKPDAEEIFTIELSPPPGTARVRFVVRDNTTAKIGSADVTVP